MNHLNPSRYTKDQLGDILMDIANELDTIQREYEVMRYKYEYLKDSDVGKIILALNTPDEGTAIEREKAARTSQDYRTHIRGRKACFEEYALIKAKYESKRRLYDTLHALFIKKQ